MRRSVNGHSPIEIVLKESRAPFSTDHLLFLMDGVLIPNAPNWSEG